MKEIDKKRIDRYLSVYNAQYCFLKELQVDYPEICGVFRIPKTFYTKKSLDHLSDVETQLCLNQLAYVGIIEATKMGQIPSILSGGSKRIPYRDTVIIESKKRFRERIDPSKDIHGLLRVKRIFTLENSILALTDFNLENGKCTGELNIALVKKK
jgi:hypothetical protein